MRQGSIGLLDADFLYELFCAKTCSSINDEEVVTASVGGEGLINRRPLTYQSPHPADNFSLTPNHFLYGQLCGTFASDSQLI